MLKSKHLPRHLNLIPKVKPPVVTSGFLQVEGEIFSSKGILTTTNVPDGAPFVTIDQIQLRDKRRRILEIVTSHLNAVDSIPGCLSKYLKATLLRNEKSNCGYASISKLKSEEGDPAELGLLGIVQLHDTFPIMTEDGLYHGEHNKVDSIVSLKDAIDFKGIILTFYDKVYTGNPGPPIALPNVEHIPCMHTKDSPGKIKAHSKKSMIKFFTEINS